MTEPTKRTGKWQANYGLPNAGLQQPMPLSETHPALWAALIEEFGAVGVNGLPIWNKMLQRIQSCTVDKQKYSEAMNAVLESSYVEIERLKKELEKEQMINKDFHNEGVAEGERRTMERVKKVIETKADLWRPHGPSENRASQIEVFTVLGEVWNELGLDNTESTGNEAYTNVGAKQ